MPRTPSVHAHKQVLQTALKLFARQGIDATSMDAIAEASGVSKATIYKHWKDKDALCLEVLRRLDDDDVPEADTDDVRADLVAALDRQPDERKGSVRTKLLPHLQAYASRNRAFAVAWRSLILERPHNRIVHLLRRAVAEGRLRKDLDIEVAVALLLGPMMYRHCLNHLERPLPPDLAVRVVDVFWSAHG